MDEFTRSDRTRVRRLPQRGVYDKAQIHAILDEAYICHVGFVADEQPFVLPLLFARAGGQIYLHGSPASRVMRAAERGLALCMTVTLVDGLVLARSAFHHSLNYRSVVMLGKARRVTDPDEKREALRLLTNHLLPGRWEEVRQPSEQELRGTAVIAFAIDEVSAKVRSGPPLDDEDDYTLPVWAGVIPVVTGLGEPVPDGRVPANVNPVEAHRFTRSKP